MKGNTRRGRKTGGAAMAQLVGALHVPVDFVLGHTEVMVQNAARPESGGLLVLAAADGHVDNVAWFLDRGVGMVRLLGMKETPARKHRQGDHIDAARPRDQIP